MEQKAESSGSIHWLRWLTFIAWIFYTLLEFLDDSFGFFFPLTERSWPSCLRRFLFFLSLAIFKDSWGCWWKTIGAHFTAFSHLVRPWWMDEWKGWQLNDEIDVKLPFCICANSAILQLCDSAFPQFRKRCLLVMSFMANYFHSFPVSPPSMFWQDLLSLSFYRLFLLIAIYLVIYFGNCFPSLSKWNLKKPRIL